MIKVDISNIWGEVSLPDLLGLEKEIFDAFYKTRKPIFGICRGMQFINVCLGGSIYQDIADLQKENHKKD